MADTTGPISSLPGAAHEVPKGATCDDHPDRPAAHRVQGETDSFGCEMIDMCDECFAAYREELKDEDTSGTCDWCKSDVSRLRPTRDYEEGTSGRVYYVCDGCIADRNKRDAEELDRLGDVWDDDGYDDAVWEETTPHDVGRSNVVAFSSALADCRPDDPVWEVDLPCSTRSCKFQYVLYYVRARDERHARARAEAMLPKRFEVDDPSGVTVKRHVPADPKRLRAERDAARSQREAVR